MMRSSSHTIALGTRNGHDPQVLEEWIQALPSPDAFKGIRRILGPNGMGKSTALSILNGTLILNLGDWRDTIWEEMTSILPKRGVTGISHPCRRTWRARL